MKKIVSDWEYKTASSGSLGFGPVAGSGGYIRLLVPGSKTEFVDFEYGGFGVGVSIGLKFPQGVFAPSDFTSYGTVLMMAGCKTEELVVDDFTGPCVYLEIGGGAVVGASACLMFVGVPAWAAGNITMLPVIMQTAKACIPMAGPNLTKQAAAGITGSTGWMKIK